MMVYIDHDLVIYDTVVVVYRFYELLYSVFCVVVN